MQGGRCGPESKPPNPGVTNNVDPAWYHLWFCFLKGIRSSTCPTPLENTKKPFVSRPENGGTKLDISPSQFKGFLGSQKKIRGFFPMGM